MLLDDLLANTPPLLAILALAEEVWALREALPAGEQESDQ